MNWIVENWEKFLLLTEQHAKLAVWPVVYGLIAAIPLGWLASRSRVAATILLPLSNVLYTIPSIAMIVIMPVIVGSKILDEINVTIPLTIYTAALLVRGIADALSSVPNHVIAAATAMGFRPLRRFVSVEFPLAVPVTIAGLRVAMVTNISMVSIASLIGIDTYGQLFIEGYQSNWVEKVWIGLLASIALAVVADLVLQVVGRVLTPWVRAGR